MQEARPIHSLHCLDPFSLIFYRSLIMLCLVIPWSVIQDKPPFPPNLSVTDRVLQVLRYFNFLAKVVEILYVMIWYRCFLTLANTVGSYFALQQMPISIQKMILSSSPIFTVVFARIFLKEHFGIIEVTRCLDILYPFILNPYISAGYCDVADVIRSDSCHPAFIYLPQGAT